MPTTSNAVRPVSTSLGTVSADTTDIKANPAIKIMAQGMNVLKPIFGAEAQLQAAVLGKLTKVDEAKVLEDIETTINQNKIVIYTYSLSPFSTEAVRILKEVGYDFKQVELGAEWFLLGGEESVARVTLSKMVNNGATSLPKIFIGGECIGGCSELAALVESGEFETLLKQKKIGKPGEATAKKLFGLF
jgi:glutaredoxin-related protein